MPHYKSPWKQTLKRGGIFNDFSCTRRHNGYKWRQWCGIYPTLALKGLKKHRFAKVYVDKNLFISQSCPPNKTKYFNFFMMKVQVFWFFFFFFHGFQASIKRWKFLVIWLSEIILKFNVELEMESFIPRQNKNFKIVCCFVRYTYNRHFSYRQDFHLKVSNGAQHKNFSHGVHDDYFPNILN